jgi:hypothetical protein
VTCLEAWLTHQPLVNRLRSCVTFKQIAAAPARHAVDKLGGVCSREVAIVNRIKAFVWVVLAVSSMMVADGAMAQRHGRYGGGRTHWLGIYLGGPLYAPGFCPTSYYYPPCYPGYYPPTIVMPSSAAGLYRK